MAGNVSCRQGHTWELAATRAANKMGQPVECPTCHAPPTLDSLGAPAIVASAVEQLRQELIEAAKAHMTGLVLYGGLARGRFRVGQSGVDLIVLLREISDDSLRAIADPLQQAWRRVAVEPWILKADEIPSIADVFPTKLLDVQEYHVVLYGDDPFRDLKIDRDHLRLHVEQGLRNMGMRLRRRYLAIIDDKGAQCRVLRRMARPLAIELAALLKLCEQLPPEIHADDRSVQIFEAAAKAFDLDRESLVVLATLRSSPPKFDEVAQIYAKILRSIDAAANVADRLRENHT